LAEKRHGENHIKTVTRALGHTRLNVGSARRFDHVCAFFSDYDGGSIGRARCDRRHDQRINHPKRFHAAHAKTRINHSLRIRPHLAGAYGMIDGIAGFADVSLKRNIASDSRTR
jgi:hypothetical protein